MSTRRDRQVQLFTGLYECRTCGNQYDCLLMSAPELVCHECTAPLVKVGPLQLWRRSYPASLVILNNPRGETT